MTFSFGSNKDFMPLAQNIAEFASCLNKGAIKEIHIEAGGKLSTVDTSPIEIAVLKGVLSANLVDINYVNAPIIAKQRGIDVKTSKINSETDSIEVKLISQDKETVIKGALLAKNIKRIVQINDYITSIEPKKHMLVVPHVNKPNMVASVATVLGVDEINISGMQVAQSTINSSDSVMIINCDSEISEATLDKINAIEGINGAKYVGIEV